MRTLTLIIAVLNLLTRVPAVASEPVPFPLAAPPGNDRMRILDAGVVVVSGGKGSTLTTIGEFERPPIQSDRYVVRGQVRAEAVAGAAYLEMWSDFGSRGNYFTRTLGTSGKFSPISGTTDWRDFELPFSSEPGLFPERLTINVVMPGGGTISVREVQLVAGNSGWWSELQGGLVGGCGGAFLGLLGAVIGVLASRRQARVCVLWLLGTGAALGAILLLIGIVALILRQPFHVAYPLLLLGAISMFVLGINAFYLRRRVRDDELRKMTALDA